MRSCNPPDNLLLPPASRPAPRLLAHLHPVHRPLAPHPPEVPPRPAHLHLAVRLRPARPHLERHLQELRRAIQERRVSRRPSTCRRRHAPRWTA